MNCCPTPVIAGWYERNEKVANTLDILAMKSTVPCSGRYVTPILEKGACNPVH